MTHWKCDEHTFHFSGQLCMASLGLGKSTKSHQPANDFLLHLASLTHCWWACASFLVLAFAWKKWHCCTTGKFLFSANVFLSVWVQILMSPMKAPTLVASQYSWCTIIQKICLLLTVIFFLYRSFYKFCTNVWKRLLGSCSLASLLFQSNHLADFVYSPNKSVNKLTWSHLSKREDIFLFTSLAFLLVSIWNYAIY